MIAFVSSQHHVAHPMGQSMTKSSASDRKPSMRTARAIFVVGTLLAAPVVLPTAASAQALGYASTQRASFPSDQIMTPDQPAVIDDGDGTAAAPSAVPARLRRTVVNLDSREAPGTVIIDTGNTALYYVLGHGQAIRYGVGVGRQGFTWSGTQTISRKAEWPDWHPPAEMIARQPYLPRFMAGGTGNPLGARAMYLGSSEYRIHGTNDPSTIGKFISSGCVRLTNEDVEDLFSRVNIGTKVVVLPKNGPHIEARAAAPSRADAAPSRPVVNRLPSGREALNLSTASIY
jgi:lipoprotein-anchoring transpeptidase ErfK/SrfK